MKIAIPAAAAVLLVVLAGCTSTSSKTPPTPAPQTTKLTATGGIVDPLTEITDKSDDRYIASDISPILDKRARGPKTFSVDITAGTKSVRAYVACAPSSQFEVHVGKKWFSGGCASTFQNWADIPLDSADSVDVDVDVPAKTRYSVLVIPTPER